MSTKINAPGWSNITVSTDALGLRKSSKSSTLGSQKQYTILSVGDSFTFGDQVSDSETWQWCINSRQDTINVLNAGVSGYGTAQSILRAKQLKKQLHFDALIVSTLVGYDFERDRLSFKDGFPIPTVIRTNQELSHSLPPDPETPGSKFSKDPINISLAEWILANSQLTRRLLPNLQSHRISLITKSITILNSESAQLDEIIPWSIQQSKSLNIPVVWLLQYSSKPTKAILDQRDYLINQLTQKKIPYIDTYPALHQPPGDP